MMSHEATHGRTQQTEEKLPAGEPEIVENRGRMIFLFFTWRLHRTQFSAESFELSVFNLGDKLNFWKLIFALQDVLFAQSELFCMQFAGWSWFTNIGCTHPAFIDEAWGPEH